MTPNNLIHIEFSDKTDFPPGIWKTREPDFCSWWRYTYPCLAIRDMKLGFWSGYVGVPKEHPAYGKDLPKLLEEKWFLQMEMPHEGICLSGKLSKYKKYSEGYWFLGWATLSTTDLLPLMPEKLETDKNKVVEIKTYKDIHFVRRETNLLAKELFAVAQTNDK
jgi:hypothetical protein